MTYYTADIGHEAAARMAAPMTDLTANNVFIEDLGDGRIRFRRNAIDYLRAERTEYEDGYIVADGDDLVMWVGGMPARIVREP